MKPIYCTSKSILLQEQLDSVLKYLLLVCLFFSIFTSLAGQSPPMIDKETKIKDECSMTLSKAERQKIIKRDANRVKTGNNKGMVRQVPIKIHIIRDANGENGLNPTAAQADINQANALFSTADFNFYQCGDINYIDNGSYHEMMVKSYEDDSPEFEMAKNNKVADALNVFYCPTAIGSNGFASWSSFPHYLEEFDKDWIVMWNNHADNGSTFSHEAGHWFDLYHTNGLTLTERVTRDPNDISCYNCNTAADLLCDTPADNGTDFTVSCGYDGVIIDPCGDTLAPLTDNIMSRAEDPCRVLFTGDQINRMQVSYDIDRTAIHHPSNCYIACPTDTFEPNNTQNEPAYIGNISTTIENLCLTSGDEDYFRTYDQGQRFIRVKGNTANVVGQYKLIYTESGPIDNRVLTIETASNSPTSIDTYLYLYDEDWVLVDSDNNSGSGLFSKIVYTIPYCTKPTNSQNKTVNISQTSAKMKCSAPGTYRDFRYKSDPTGPFIELLETTANHKWLIGLNPGTTYYWQSRVYCPGGPWSDWSQWETFTTLTCTPATPTASEIDNSQNVYCDYAYGICQGHPGDYKQFRLENLSTGAVVFYHTTAHFRHFPNLTPSTGYRYKVRIKCGTTGSFGSWSPNEFFATPACLSGETGSGSTAERSDAKLKSSSIVNTPELLNYPNPFNGQTTIEFDLDNDTAVTLYVSDVTGKKIQVLLNNEERSQGTNQVTFNGNDHPAGIYYYTMQAGEHVITKKMILLK